MAETVETLLLRIQALEARLNDLSPSPNPSTVVPEGMLPFDAKKRIEALESNVYYKNWIGREYGELVISDTYVKRSHGDAMFDGIYHMVPSMTLLKKLKMVSTNGNPLDYGLTVLPDLHRIKNRFVEELVICSEFDVIPYAVNFPSLRRLEIVNHPFKPTNNNKQNEIADYCKEYGITALIQE